MYSKKGSSPFSTVTFRLTLMYALLFGALSLAVFVIVYLSLTSGLGKRTDDELIDTLHEFTSLYESQGTEALEAEFRREAQSRGVDHVFFRLISKTGEVTASSELGAWKGLGKPGLQSKSANGGKPAFVTLKIPGHAHRARVVSGAAGDGHFIELGTTLTGNELLMERYRETFGYAVLVMLISGVLVGRLMARRAMSGVQRVTRTALQIGGKDLGRRVPIGKEGQEINELVQGFNEMLERIERLVGELKSVSDNVAHDLKSPLTRIRGMAETTLSGPEDIKNYKEMAGAVIEESDRLVDMINTMLEIARTDSGIAHLDKSRLDLSGIVREAVDLFGPLAEDRDGAIQCELPKGPVFVRGDIGRLQRAVANVLDNAIKYSGEGGIVKLVLKTDAGQAKLLISDRGPGISEADMPRVFDRFYRAEKSRTTPGSGLGLSLALAIVRAHGGDISIKSSEGNGSEFTITLPLLTSPPPS